MVAWISVALLAASAVAVGVAPRLMVRGYSWEANTISESAAQGVRHAWVARAGFAGLGAGAVLVAVECRSAWGIAAFCLIVVFGVLMMATAGASERPWEAGAPYRAKEAQLHSVLAGAAGVAYTVGAGTVAFTDAGAPVWLRALSLVVAVSGVVLPLAMARRPQVQGLIQRVMFALAYAWLIAEALHGGG